MWIKSSFAFLLICAFFILCNGQDALCGRRKISSRIVEGFATNPVDFPWHVAVFQIIDKTKNYVCGGTLIDKFHVVTAAHCVVDETGFTLPNTMFEIEFGLHDLRFLQAATRGRVAKVIPHERYTVDSHRFDIALLKLESSVTFSSLVQPVCLWKGSIKKLAEQNTLGLAIGWGDTGKGVLANDLRAANLLIKDTDDCREQIKDIQGLLHSTHFCAGYKNGTTMCLGDSGGGMFIEVKETFYMVGIVSFSAAIVGENGITCGRDDYSVFMNIPNLNQWIQLKTKSSKYTEELLLYHNHFMGLSGCRMASATTNYYNLNDYISMDNFRYVGKTENSTYFRFGAMGKNDALIRISKKKMPFNNDYSHEILVGCSNNMETEARRQRRDGAGIANDSLKKSKTPNILSEIRPISFIMEFFTNGLVTLTLDDDREPFLEFSDPKQIIGFNFVGFANLNSKMIFFFDCPFIPNDEDVDFPKICKTMNMCV